jgi:hypothetical protein
VPTAQDKFKQLLAGDFGPWLKDRDFRRRDSTFRRRREDAWQIVNFQRNRYSTSRAVPFTVNLGVSLDLLHDEPPWRARGWPLEYECDFRERIGALHHGEDHWWTVRPLLPTRGIVRDVLAALEKGLLWLDVHADPHVLLADALRDLSAVDAFNVASLVAVAKRVGDESDVRKAEAELQRLHGERLAF